MEKHVRKEIDEETREKLCASVHFSGEPIETNCIIALRTTSR